MNAALVKKALEKVLDPNILVNLVSRRVRQLTSGGGGLNRPLVADVANLGAADIALREIIEEKMGFETAGNRRAHSSLGKEPPATSALDKELAEESQLAEPGFLRCTGLLKCCSSI